MKQTYSQSDINLILKKLGDDQSIAFKNASLEDFMHPFNLDIVSDYYIRRWFTGYTQKVEKPVECTYTVASFTLLDENRIECCMEYALTYENYESEGALFSYKIKLGEEIKITDASVTLRHIPWKDTPRNDIPTIHFPFRSEDAESFKREWWEMSERVEHATHSKDILKAALYARAIPSSSRFRQTHPEIDCAALLSDMMTFTTIRLAYSTGTDDPATFLKAANVFSQKKMVSKEYKEIRSEDPSYFPARELSLQPLYTLDEVFTYMKTNPKGFAEVGCSEVASFYMSLMRLAGINPFKAVIIVQPFHYLFLFSLEKGYYIMSVNEIIPMTPKRLYGDTDVSRIITPVFFIDEMGYSNMSSDHYNNVKKFINSNVPIFNVPGIDDDQDIIEMSSEPNFNIKNCSTPFDLHHKLKTYVWNMSREYPASPFTWGKYAYRSLLVNQPQAYVIWSLKAKESENFVTKYKTDEEILNWIGKNIKRKSIYSEPERIMTAEQVIRHKMGEGKDIALFFFTMCKLKNSNLSGGVVITDKSAYAVCIDESDTLSIYNFTNHEKVKRIEGEIITAFDDTGCCGKYIQNGKSSLLWLDKVV
jgi:hypothetical protein